MTLALSMAPGGGISKRADTIKHFQMICMPDWWTGIFFLKKLFYFFYFLYFLYPILSYFFFLPFCFVSDIRRFCFFLGWDGWRVDSLYKACSKCCGTKLSCMHDSYHSSYIAG